MADSKMKDANSRKPKSSHASPDKQIHIPGQPLPFQFDQSKFKQVDNMRSNLNKQQHVDNPNATAGTTGHADRVNLFADTPTINVKINELVDFAASKRSLYYGLSNIGKFDLKS